MSNNVYYSEWIGKRTGYAYRLEIVEGSSTSIPSGYTGAIISWSVGSAGTGYSSGTYALSGGSGSGAMVTIVASNGAATSLSIVNGGTGYSGSHTNPTTGGTGTGLVLDISESGGVVNAVSVREAGSGYTAADIVTAVGGNGDCLISIDSVSNGAVTSITFTNTGVGYTGADTLTIASGNNDATLTSLSVVSSGKTGVALPMGCLKMGTYETYEYDNLPIGTPSTPTLTYEVDIDMVYAVSPDCVQALLSPSTSYNHTFNDFYNVSKTYQIKLGTIHTLKIDPDGGTNYTTVFIGIQQLGAEQGLDSGTHMSKIEVHCAMKTAMEIALMVDVPVNTLSLGSTLIVDSYGILRGGITRDSAVASLMKLNGYTYSLNLYSFFSDFVTGIGDAVYSLLVRDMGSITYDTNTFLAGVGYYKRVHPQPTGARAAALDLTTSGNAHIVVFNSKDNTQAEYGYCKDDESYGESSYWDWMNDFCRQHLRRMRFDQSSGVLRFDSLIPAAFKSIGTGLFERWSIKTGDATYLSIEASCKEKKGDDYGSWTAKAANNTENSTSTSVGMAFQTCGIAVKRDVVDKGAIDPLVSYNYRFGTLLYNELTTIMGRTMNLPTCVHPQPVIYTKFSYNGTYSGNPNTDDIIGVKAVTQGIHRETSLPVGTALLEQSTNGIEYVISNTLLHYFGRPLWSAEIEIGIEELLGAGTTADPLFHWLGSPKGLSFDLSQEQYRSYLSAITPALPTDWICMKCSVDLHTEVATYNVVENLE